MTGRSFRNMSAIVFPKPMRSKPLSNDCSTNRGGKITPETAARGPYHGGVRVKMAEMFHWNVAKS